MTEQALLTRSGITYAIKRRVARWRGKKMVWFRPAPRRLSWSPAEGEARVLVMTDTKLELRAL